jgi:exodeoxyribonuclease V alpha subunit
LPNASLAWWMPIAVGFSDLAKALSWIERKVGLTLAESQIAAVRLALRSKVLVITGGPGVGKTTIVNAILRILVAKGVQLLLCTPTVGRHELGV